MRKSITFKIKNPEEFKSKLLVWGSSFEKFCFLNSNNYSRIVSSPHTYHKYDSIAGAGVAFRLPHSGGDVFDRLKEFSGKCNDWILGYLTYEAKNELEESTYCYPDKIMFPQTDFFSPRYLFLLTDTTLQILFRPETDDETRIRDIYDEISETVSCQEPPPSIDTITPVFSRNDYLKTVEILMGHIKNGDLYELNFCQEFFNDNVKLNPAETYLALNRVSPTPFSCFYRHGESFLMCASPERFLKKMGSKVVSQPIKGTCKRGNTPKEDERLAGELKNDPKERAENIMTTDIVRNDLSLTAASGSVRVPELCGIYRFPQVHQMISTIEATIGQNIHFTDIIREAFPMGSMTGAPKAAAMNLIGKYERTKRGLFSGTVGYITPERDFDFNVVIRSIQYNRENKHLSFTTGGAITSLSVPEKEYNECLLKAKAIMHIFNTKRVG